MVRTLFLLLGFAWFTNQGALFGDTTLAANHVLLQLITMSAYLLDGYAHATEVFAGRAIGRGDRGAFDDAVRAATELAVASGVVLAAAVLLLGPAAVGALTDLESVRQTATSYLPFAAVYVLVSFAAFQLDGIYIGATWTRAMRNASIASLAVFLAASLWTIPRAANAGLWSAFVLYVVVRAVTLAVAYPRLRRRALGPG
jgi:MATE family multidrug resistance protein